MTEEELREVAAAWQKRLRLQDWTVHVCVKRAHEMDLANKSGEIEWILNRREAWMTIRDLVDIPDLGANSSDQEETVVHELLHLFTAPLDLPDSGPKQTAEEQMINAVAAALVALLRQEADQCRINSLDKTAKAPLR